MFWSILHLLATLVIFLPLPYIRENLGDAMLLAVYVYGIVLFPVLAALGTIYGVAVIRKK